MDHNLSGKETLKRYLLGDLPRHQRKQIERRFFEDTDFLKCLLDAEKKLIADYNQGVLDQHERSLFERQFPKGATQSQWVKQNEEKLGEIGLYTQVDHPYDVNGHRSPSKLTSLLEWWRLRKKVLRFAFAAAAVVLLAAALFVILVWTRNSKPTPRVAQSNEPTPLINQPSPQQHSSVPTPSESPRYASSPLPSPASTPPSKDKSIPPSSNTIIATLVPGLTRGSTESTITINPDDAVVLLQLRLFENKHESYSADLRNEDRRVIRRLSARRAQLHGDFSSVDFHVSANLLVEDFYYLTLYGTPVQGKKVVIDTYPFSVERK